MRINHPEWYPAYPNPTFDELVELAKSGWDTCRILIDDDRNNLVIGSGYGNTHSSLVERYRLYLGKKRSPYINLFILYRENGIAYMNLEDVSGGQRSRYELWPIDEPFAALLRDLVRESGLAL